MIIETSKEDNRDKLALGPPDSKSENQSIEIVDTSSLNGSVDYVVSFVTKSLSQNVFFFFFNSFCVFFVSKFFNALSE